MNNVAQQTFSSLNIVVERARRDANRFRRVRVDGAGRLFIPATQEEFACSVEAMSPGDAVLLCAYEASEPEVAVLYLEQYGRLEGTIAGRSGERCVMTFSCTPHKRDLLVDQLMLQLNRHLVKDAGLRKHDRIVPSAASFTKITQSTGQQMPCEVLDFSPSGILLRTQTRPMIGEHILVGQRAARVTQHHSEGVGIEFLVPSSSNSP